MPFHLQLLIHHLLPYLLQILLYLLKHRMLLYSHHLPYFPSFLSTLIHLQPQIAQITLCHALYLTLAIAL